MKLEQILPEIRKGRRFRPIGADSYLSFADLDNLNNYKASFFLTREFELEPEKKLVSLEELKKVWDEHIYKQSQFSPANESFAFGVVARQLGFSL